MRMLIVACAFGIANAAVAQDPETLQQRASFAYREMQQAERDAEQAAIETKRIDAQASELQKQLEVARKSAVAAQVREKAARSRAAEARKRWEAAADALDNALPRSKP